MKPRVGEWEEPDVDGQRIWQLTRAAAIGDVIDALVELTTNSDDSYGRLGKEGGPITIRYEDHRVIQVADRAEGLNSDDMRSKIKGIGGRMSKEGDRGYMGRGAKDCTKLGVLTYESIKDDRHYKCVLGEDGWFKLEIPGERVDTEIRERLGIPRRNGTVVTLQVKPGPKFPRLTTLCEQLRWHYAIRDIVSETSASTVKIIGQRDAKQAAEPLVWQQPAGDLLLDEHYVVPGYPEARPRLRVWRCVEPLKESSDPRFRRHGLLIKGKRAIHECSSLCDEFRKDPNALRFFGRIDCTYIDVLLDEYEKRRKARTPQTLENPDILVDPLRHRGLLPDHPFTNALLQLPIEKLKALLDKEREAKEKEAREISNTETKTRLRKLAKALGRILQECLEDLDEVGKGEVDEPAFAKKGVMIFPHYPTKIAVGQVKKFAIYVKKAGAKDPDAEWSVSADSLAIEVLNSIVRLQPSKSRADRLIGYFTVKGTAVHPSVCITASCPEMPEAEAIIEVVDAVTEFRDFKHPLEFEHDSYSVREGRRRTVRLYAQFPDAVATDISVGIVSSNSADISVRGKCVVRPVAGTNYALGEIEVEGRRLGATGNLKAAVDGHAATARVRVIQADPEEKGVDLDFKIKDEDFGDRAMWGGDRGEPNILYISGKHESISRYLGPPLEYAGQDHPGFRILIAEIIAESFCRKLLLLEAKEKGFEFGWAQLKEPYLIAESVTHEIQKRMRKIVTVAHKHMVSPSEAHQIRISNVPVGFQAES